MPIHKDGTARRNFLNVTAYRFQRAGGIPDDAPEELTIFLEAAKAEITAIATRLCDKHNLVEVDDVVSATLLDLQRGGFPASILDLGEGTFIAWLRETTGNNFRDEIRRRRARRADISVELDETAHFAKPDGRPITMDPDARILIKELYAGLSSRMDKTLFQYLVGLRELDETIKLLGVYGYPVSQAGFYRKLNLLKKKLKAKTTWRA